MKIIRNLSYLFLYFILLARSAYADADATASVLGGIPKPSVLGKIKPGWEGISQIIGNVLNFVYVFAVLFVFFNLISAGFGWISSGGDKGKLETAQKKITNSLIGLALIAVAALLTNLAANIFGFDSIFNKK